MFDVKVWHTVLSLIAPSTKQAYEKIFFDFVQFAEDRELDFDSMLIDAILSFLQRFVGLSQSRIRTAVAALKFFLKIYKRLDLVENPLLDMFAKGAQNLAPIPREKCEIWNPMTVLNWIQTQPVPSLFLPCAREAMFCCYWQQGGVWTMSGNSRVAF
jgi:hypothetical protein